MRPFLPVRAYHYTPFIEVVKHRGGFLRRQKGGGGGGDGQEKETLMLILPGT